MYNRSRCSVTDKPQEFVDARRRVVTLQNAPQVLFRNDPPLDLQGVPGLNAGEGEISYVTFGTFLSYRNSSAQLH